MTRRTEAELEALGAPHGLTAQQVSVALDYDMPLQRYAAMSRRMVGTAVDVDFDEWSRLRADDAERESALVEARRMLAVDAMRKRLEAEATS